MRFLLVFAAILAGASLFFFLGESKAQETSGENTTMAAQKSTASGGNNIEERLSKLEAQAKESELQAKIAEKDRERLNALLGSVPKSDISGDVTLKGKAGTAEAELLGAKAVQEISRIIIEKIKDDLKGRIILISSEEMPDFGAVIRYNYLINIFEKSFGEANADSREFLKQPVPKQAAVPLAGAGLEAVTNLLSFFRSEYTVGGVEVSINTEALLSDLAGEIKSLKKNSELFVPGILNPAVLAETEFEVSEKLESLFASRDVAASYIERHNKKIEELRKKLETVRDEKERAKIQKEIDEHEQKRDRLNSIISRFDIFVGQLTSLDEKNKAWMQNIVEQLFLIKAAEKEEAVILVADLQYAGGSYYTRKNLWTVFGSMPFYHMGGATATYILFDGKTGTVLNGGLVPYHGGFVKAKKLKSKVNDNEK